MQEHERSKDDHRHCRVKTKKVTQEGRPLEQNDMYGAPDSIMPVSVSGVKGSVGIRRLKKF